uniref:Uncharacterized protein n=1 Tax=Anopheles merus TaxID=30066 RepID=A0A182UQW4_ANOME
MESLLRTGALWSLLVLSLATIVDVTPFVDSLALTSAAIPPLRSCRNPPVRYHWPLSSVCWCHYALHTLPTIVVLMVRLQITSIDATNLNVTTSVLEPFIDRYGRKLHIAQRYYTTFVTTTTTAAAASIIASLGPSFDTQSAVVRVVFHQAALLVLVFPVPFAVDRFGSGACVRSANIRTRRSRPVPARSRRSDAYELNFVDP